MSAITVTGARKTYGTTPVLLGVDLSVPEGSITAVLGQSGSGKTTLLRSVAGFERLDAGSITIGDVAVDGPQWVHPQHRGVGYVPQHGALFPHLRVNANIGFGVHRAEHQRITELVELLGLGALEKRFPHELSGGQQQRVALARALAPRPSVVLLDEPFSSLDAALRASLRAEVTRVLRTVGATTIIVTHDRDEALSMADQIALLQNGRIRAVGRPRDLYTAPDDEPTARFLGTANLVPATMTAGRLDCPIPVPTNGYELVEGTYTLLLRPEHLAIDVQPTGRAAPATALTVSYMGGISEVRLQLHDDAATQMVAFARGCDDISAGQTIWVSGTHLGVAWPEPSATRDRPPDD